MCYSKVSLQELQYANHSSLYRGFISVCYSKLSLQGLQYAIQNSLYRGYSMLFKVLSTGVTVCYSKFSLQGFQYPIQSSLYRGYSMLVKVPSTGVTVCYSQFFPLVLPCTIQVFSTVIKWKLTLPWFVHLLNAIITTD